MTVAPEYNFITFPNLPAELRIAIWRECLPSRIVEPDVQQDEVIWARDSPCDVNWKITWVNKAPPVIARVCRESRAVAFENGSLIDIEAHRFSNNMVERPWLDPARDSIHLNWEPAADIEWQSYDWGDPVRSLLELAALTQCGRVSFMMEHLVHFQDRTDPDQPDERYRWTRSEMVDILLTRPTWTVVVLFPVIIHADVTTAAGLFGLLGDARVQVISDEAEIQTFLALDERPNVTIDGAFTMEELAAEKEQLQATAEAVLGSAVSEIKLKPAVMFRLCTNGCK